MPSGRQPGTSPRPPTCIVRQDGNTLRSDRGLVTAPERSDRGPELSSDFAFDVVDVTGARVVCLHGQLDLVNAARVRDVIAEVDGSPVVVDLQGLWFLDSSGIASLLAARQLVTDSGRPFQLRGARGIVLRALEVTGLTHLLTE